MRASGARRTRTSRVLPVGSVVIASEKGVRRVPVLTHSGALAGILTIDDLLDLMAEELGAFARTIDQERVREMRARR